MSERLTRPALRALLEAANGILAAAHGKTIHDYESDWLLRHGIQRGIEIISEAARRIPPELQTTQPQIPRLQIMGIGNVLRHEYHRISDVVIWNVVREHVEPLRAAVAAIDANLDES